MDRIVGLLSSRLPAVSVALVAVIISSVFISKFFLTGDGRPVPLPELPGLPSVSELTSQAPAAPSRTRMRAPSVTAIPLAAVTSTFLFVPGISGTLTSPDGAVTITVDLGAIDGPVNLTYVPLDITQIPGLPDGYTAADVAFHLIPTTVQEVEIDEFNFNRPVEFAIRLSGAALEMADNRPDLITVQHYKTSIGWTKLPTRLELGSDTILVEVLSLSIFAVLVEQDESPAQVPELHSPTATFTPSSTPTLTPVPVIDVVPTGTPTSVVAAPSTATPISKDADVPETDAVPEPTAEVEVTPSSTVVGTQIPGVIMVSAPDLVDPPDGGTIDDMTPTFEWISVEGDDVVYELQISRRNDFTPLVFSEITPELSLTLSRAQRLDLEDYGWRVRAISSDTQGPFSAVYSLTIRRGGVGGVTGGGGAAASATTPDLNALSVTITSPLDGSQVYTRILEVRGTVSGLAPHVEVNEVEAEIEGNTFLVLIHLDEGLNELMATAADPSGTVSDRVFVTLETLLISVDFTLDSFSTSYNPDDTRAPAGVLTGTAIFTNRSSTNYVDVFFEVTHISGGNEVLNADGGPGRTGSTISSGQHVPSGGVMTQIFEVGMQVLQPVQFLWDIFGTPN